MKRLFAVVMVVAILFNTGGYDLFFKFLMYRSESKIFDRINNNRYSASDLIEIKVPVVFPEQASPECSGEYEAIGGQIQIKNNKYDYAEIKITQDTLYLRVIPNPALSKLVKANVLYGKLVNDQPNSSTKHSNNTLAKKGLSQSILVNFPGNQSLSAGVIKKSYHNFTIDGILKPSLEVGAQPPEA
ncbi:MAG TPA: hypothetical protein VHE59_05725 [Mucilaginibacter sp.]|nr:hypothetical protein [Mucilaginibacter sp.]